MNDTKVVRTEGRKEFLHMMFTTALEGGIGYWSKTSTYKWSKPGNYTMTIENKPFSGSHNVTDLDGFHAVIESNEGDWGIERKWFKYPKHLRIDIDVMERGWNLFVDKVIAATKSEDPGAPFSRIYLRQAVVQWLTDGVDGDSDADVADHVVQLGLFGEIMYA